jgi:hypothetical protein
MLKGVHLTLMMGAVEPSPVSAPVIEALTEAQVTVSAGQRSGFQLGFTAGKKSPILREYLPSGFFDPPRRVVLVVTLNGNSQVLMDGVITRHDYSPSNEVGQSKLTITGEDLSRMLDLIDFSGLIPYICMPAEARVLLMLAKYAFYGIVPKVIPSVLIDVPLPTRLIPAQQGTDLEYLNMLAENVGYVFYLEPGPVPGMNTAYWGPEIKTGTPQAALIVNSDAENNVGSLSFSFDGFAKTLFVILIQERITKLPIPIPVPDVNPLSPPLGSHIPFPLRVRPLTGMAKYTPLQAALIGLAKAAKSADVISGSGSLDVQRYGRILKARQLVEVKGAGKAHDGLYYVKSVTHNIKPGEYKQNFTLARNAFS